MDLTPEVIRSSIENLIRLQEIDGQLFALNAERNSPPAEYLEAKKKVDELQRVLRALDRTFREADRERRSLELRAMTLREDIKRAEGKRASVRNTKEEFAATKELEAFQKKANDNHKLLEEKEKIAQEKSIAKDEKTKALAELQAQMSEFEANRKTRVEELEKEIGNLGSKRAEYISNVDEQIFSLYERVQRLRKGSGVALVKGFTCTGCHVSIPPQLRYKLEKMEDLITCSSCSRILFPGDDSEADQSTHPKKAVQ